jgi:alginate O-acetyltransferase complex protein AlgI
LWIARCREQSIGKYAIGLACAANVLLLGFYKYANFLVDNLNVVLTGIGLDTMVLSPVHLPIGISFFTFQAISYVVDVYRGTSRVQKNPLDMALYIALFPQLIAGPIIRYHDVATQIRNRQHTLNDAYLGIRRFVFGLTKKLVIANPLGLVADQVFAIPAEELTAPLAWLGIVAYSLQLYFDFSAYSCMAIGLGRVFGFHFLENFNYPYISRSVQEFWRRWHISLSNWFRDYLYIPLGGNRIGERRTYLNLLLVFLLCGLWHGASWNFVIWGLFHGAFLIMERLGLSALLARFWRPLQHAYVLMVVMVAWVFFRAETLPYAMRYLQAMAGFGSGSGLHDDARFLMTPEFLWVMVAAIIFSTPVWLRVQDVLDKPRQGVQEFCVQCSGLAVLAIASLCCVLYVAAGSYNPFIYFRF